MSPYFALKTLLHTLLLPPASSVAVGVIGLLLLRRFRRLGITLVVMSQVSLYLFSIPLLADPLTRLAERYPALDLSKPIDAQALVIIGGGGQRRFAPEYGGPAPNYVLLTRLTYGAFVARRLKLPVLVSGSPDEALAMQTSLERDFGIRAEWVENQSQDTFQNANLTARILRPEGMSRIVLVTAGSHMNRAAREFEAVGFQVTAAPAEVWIAKDLGMWRFLPTADALLHSNSAVYELIGERARRVQAALHIRQLLDPKAVADTVG